MTNKRPIDIDLIIERLRRAVAPLPKAALFQLAEEGYRSAFEILVACIISVRTRDETTLVCARRLFEMAPTPADVVATAIGAIDDAIRPCTFHEAKAPRIAEIARRVVEDHGGSLPCDEEVILSFPGVGPKCANLVLGIVCGESRIGVDVHVHRVTNRWGYIHECTPEQSMRALEQKLPAGYRVEINSLLVPFGKHICTGTRPRCSECPVLDRCLQVGVTDHR